MNWFIKMRNSFGEWLVCLSLSLQLLFFFAQNTRLEGVRHLGILQRKTHVIRWWWSRQLNGLNLWWNERMKRTVRTDIEQNRTERRRNNVQCAATITVSPSVTGSIECSRHGHTASMYCIQNECWDLMFGEHCLGTHTSASTRRTEHRTLTQKERVLT